MSEQTEGQARSGSNPIHPTACCGWCDWWVRLDGAGNPDFGSLEARDTSKLGIVIRIAILFWHILWAGARLGLRVLWNRVAGKHASVSSNVGRTLAEVLERLGPTYIKL